jgi:hypothetical protein
MDISYFLYIRATAVFIKTAAALASATFTLVSQHNCHAVQLTVEVKRIAGVNL